MKRLPFHRIMKKVLLEAFSNKSLHPDQLAQKILQSSRRPCGKEERPHLKHLIQQREISSLLHFTALDNVPSICHFGLIPRDLLKEEPIMMYLNAQFSDDFRYENKEECNCLSVSFPNYKMFYRKQQDYNRRWAVIEFDVDVITELWAEFCPTNAANRGRVPIYSGVRGLKWQFLSDDIRAELELPDELTTDPQAEVLCDSVIDPRYIRSVNVRYNEDVDWLANHHVHATVNEHFFRARYDFNFWKGRSIKDFINFEHLDSTGSGEHYG
ncbi:DUF4433 domain-containing protein [Endozoicomonas euniceicola]|uniref:DUF4433 domain-containing protein n=1 Tax=Endozoicomonas euniceicola TaxID=1234143 RepID=A0ABY6GW82_9GAMM|nr:DUF4433 domain-containing protein [Endozoicomonas euniceicola]UYM16346.1 DUF4433 domain-containing protein [Endozoicomonas euniceicola]